MTVKCRKKVPINGLTLAFFARDAADVRSIRYILFSGFRKKPIHICLFFCHCPMDLLVCSGKYCIFEYPTHICLFVSPSPSHPPACLLCGNIRVSGAVTQHSRWMAERRLLRDCIFIWKTEKSSQEDEPGLKGEKYGLLGTHVHFPKKLLLYLFTIRQTLSYFQAQPFQLE